MPTRRLPAHPDFAQLKQQAKDLLRAQRAHSLHAAQRIREFHPRFRKATDDQIGAATLKLSDAQLAIAREYGFASWPRLKAHLEDPFRDELNLPINLRISDAAFRRAVELLDAGDVEGLREHLRRHPDLVRQRTLLEGGNYFREPKLLEFIAENPTRNGSLPPNIVDVARVILDAGARDDRENVSTALALVASSDVTRKCGVQSALIDLLCDYGADPNPAVYPSLLYCEFPAVEKLIERGATVDVVVATGMGWLAQAQRLLANADDETRQRALALAAQLGYLELVRVLLDAGANPNRFAPVGGHSHATPLHQAALGGHLDVVKLLVDRGARTDITDIHHDDTPLQWAEYGKQDAVAEYLRGLTSDTG